MVQRNYRIPKLRLDILPLEAFISRYPEEAFIKVESTEVEVSPGTLPRALRVYVFEPAG